MRYFLVPAGVMLACMLPTIASGQAERVIDLNTAGADSYPRQFTRLGTNTFLSADDGEHGEELWVIPDGSPARLVKDINPGPLSSSPSSLTVVGTQLFFVAMTKDEGRELWRSDGTESGTVLVADIRAGSEGSSPQYLTAYDGKLFFSADDGNAGRELWTSDGTTASLVRDIEPGPGSSWPSSLREVPDGAGGSMLIFSAETSTWGAEPWTSDGTESNTLLLPDLNTGGSSNPGDFAVVSDRLIFFRANGGMGAELWRYDPAALAPPQEHIVAPPARGSYPLGLTAFDGDLFFSAAIPGQGRKLVIFYDDAHFNFGNSFREPDGFLATSERIFFAGIGVSIGRELCFYDPARGIVAAHVNPGAGSATPTGITADHAETVFFAADDGTHGMELWKVTPASPALPSLVKDIRPGAGSGLGNLNGLIVADATGVIFRADDGVHGLETWHSDGTEAGTRMLADINTATADAVPDPGGLELRCWVGGRLRQHASTASLRFGFAFLVSYLSTFMRLTPGDLIATGTPSGVGPVEVGDLMEVEIDGIGVLANRIVAGR